MADDQRPEFRVMEGGGHAFSEIPLIKQLAASILRNLMRAMVSQSPDTGISRAFSEAKQLQDIIQRSKGDIRLWDVLAGAVEGATPKDERTYELGQAMDRISEAAVSYFAERSDYGDAHKGRLSQRSSNLRHHVNYYNELTEEQRRNWDAKYRKVPKGKRKSKKKPTEPKNTL